MNNVSRNTLVAAVTLAVSASAALAGGPGRFTAHLLAAQGEFGGFSFDLNQAGAVAGEINLKSGIEAAIWNSKGVKSLTPGVFGSARGLNDVGQAVGAYDNGSNFVSFLYDNGSLIEIMTDAGFGQANRINNSGLVAGNANGSAAIWTSAGGTQILSFAGVSDGFGNANAVSNSGFVVGETEANSGGPFTVGRAFRYDSNTGTMLDLGTLGGTLSQALGVNDHGDVVGTASDAFGNDKPFLYRDGVMIDLGLPDGEFSGFARAINNNGQIIGVDGGGFFGPGTPWLWENGVKTDLASLVTLAPNLILIDVIDINDAGEILVHLRDIDTFTNFAAILRPDSAVPTPGAGSLALMTLAFAGARRRR